MKQQPQLAQLDKAPTSLLEAAQRAFSFLNGSGEDYATEQVLQELKQRCRTVYEHDLLRMSSSRDSRRGASAPPTVIQDQIEVASASPHTVTDHNKQSMPDASHRDGITENDRRPPKQSSIARDVTDVQRTTTSAKPLNPGSVSMNTKPLEESISSVTPQQPMQTKPTSAQTQTASSDTTAPAKHVPATTQPPILPKTPAADASGATTRALEEPAQTCNTQSSRVPSPATGMADPGSTDSKALDDPLSRDVHVAPSSEAKPHSSAAVINGMMTPNQNVDIGHLVKDITMFLRIQRESDPEPEDFNPIYLHDVLSRGQLWTALQEELGSELNEGEEFVRVQIKRASGCPVQGIRTEFRMLKASGRDASWDALLNGLRRLYNRENRTVEWELEATVHVKMKGM